MLVEKPTKSVKLQTRVFLVTATLVQQDCRHVLDFIAVKNDTIFTDGVCKQSLQVFAFSFANTENRKGRDTKKMRLLKERAWNSPNTKIRTQGNCIVIGQKIY